MTKLLALVLCIGCFLGACSADGDDSSGSTADTTTTESAAPASPADLDAFCDRLLQLQRGELRDVESLRALYADLLANAPAELTDDVAYFVEHSSAVSEAIAAAGVPEELSQAEVDAAMAGLEPETREFVDGLASAAQTGVLPEGPTGAVLRYGVESC
jgi:hypothetical protein